MKFKDLTVGDVFVFAKGTTFPDDCRKTGPRSYETVAWRQHYLSGGGYIEKPMKLQVGTVDVEVEKKA